MFVKIMVLLVAFVSGVSLSHFTNDHSNIFIASSVIFGGIFMSLTIYGALKINYFNIRVDIV